ncbi:MULTISPECIES: lysozyme inhibitor LprI family protein [Comamonas]|uniref:lysozyme inhibitor LprI family protein n=1 Tax=Comamonas TaxID=283 RepID=UPI0006B9A375|nr:MULTISPECIES: lysozyme inhibitor LprI family protein [Comamonas]
MNKRAILLVVLTAAALGAQAEQKSNISAERDRCGQNIDLGAMKNSQWAACDEAELPRLDKKLNQVYGKVRGSLDGSQKAQMTKGQKAWLEYRESWCRFREQAKLGPFMGYLVYTSCMVQMTDEKINELKDLAEAASSK